MIEKRPSLFVLALRDVWLTSDVAVTVTFSTGFLSGPRTWPRMMSASPCARSRPGRNALQIRRKRNIERRGDTGRPREDARMRGTSSLRAGAVRGWAEAMIREIGRASWRG